MANGRESRLLGSSRYSSFATRQQRDPTCAPRREGVRRIRTSPVRKRLVERPEPVRHGHSLMTVAVRIEARQPLITDNTLYDTPEIHPQLRGRPRRYCILLSTKAVAITP